MRKETCKECGGHEYYIIDGVVICRWCGEVVSCLERSGEQSSGS